MTEFRKYALFQLVVVGVAAVAVVVILVATRNVMASLAGFAVLGLLGLRTMVLRGAGSSPVQDERDAAIQRRATVAGYTALWIGLVAWGVAVPLTFGDQGSVPLAWVVPVVWVGWWLVLCVRSIAILVLDARGS
jgi:hypothetical protein